MRLSLLLTLLTLTPAIPCQTPQAINDLYLIEYAGDLAARDQLIEAGSFYGDLGRYGVARLDSSTATRVGESYPVAEIPPVYPGESLLAIARNRAGIGPMHGRLLMARRSLFLMAAKPSQIPEDCRGSGFHGGVQVLALDAPYVPVKQHSFDVAEMPDPAIQAMVSQVNQSNLQGHVTSLANIFTRRTTRPENAQAIAYVTNQLRQIPNITFRTETFNSSYGPNIIAELPGTDLANEIVMVGAHIDSIVGGNSSARSAGADDNASGSAAVLEIARIFATQSFRRTIRFGWWNAEELGLVGSNAYASAARSRGDNIIAYVNTDMNAYRRAGDTLSVDYVTNDSTPSLIAALQAATQTYVPTLATNVGSLSGGTSDHRAFFRNGFVAAFPFEDIGNYSPFIHTTNDTVGTSANDFTLSRLITQSVLAGMAELAEIGYANPGEFSTFGQGCPGTGQIPSICASNNPNGGTLDNTTRTNEYAYRVPHTGSSQVTSFELFTRSTTGGSVTVGAYIYADANGLPGSTALASTTMTVGAGAGFYTATFSNPVPVNGTFHIALDHSAQTTVLANLTAGAAGSGSWRRPPRTGTWSSSGLIDRPAFRVHCAGGTNNAVPEIGNDGLPIVNRTYDVTLERAAANAPAALLIGVSDSIWSGGTLPMPIPGAPGCNLLVSPDASNSATANQNGSARNTYPVPNNANLIGFVLYHQWAIIDLGANTLGVAFSDAGKSKIGG